MTKPKNRLFCRLDGLTPIARQQQRLSILDKLGLLTTDTVPVFEEATQTASSFLEVPICILGLAVEKQLWFKSAAGLSSIGLMNQLASHRKLPLDESFSTYVVDSGQVLVIDNTVTNSVFASSILVQHYGIRAYLGVPLISAEGYCIGSLEVMDTEPHFFSSKDIEFLALTARWCLREFERDCLLNTQSRQATEIYQDLSIDVAQKTSWQPNLPSIQGGLTSLSKGANSTSSIKMNLLSQLTQELRTPLTSVIGMASVLRREVYGPLTGKQREYLEIIHNSGQSLISLVDEIVNLGVLSEQDSHLQISSVDIEMICQQVINSLVDIGRQQQQELRLSVEPGNRIWLLDKDKVRQALYYLIINVIEIAEAGGEVRVHVSRRNQALNIAVWLSHPWLGDGLHQVEFYSQSVTKALALSRSTKAENKHLLMSDVLLGNQVLTSSALMSAININNGGNINNKEKISRDVLGLLLSCHLVELHGGQVIVQGTPESGYRYILKLPRIESEENYRLE
ncbi:GAF domain-containing sensor histidine kinase [Pleurocapsales cyanobacterium LEGE 06147]|nr:GAF domain-containing sensor histidine kinase [Pleurocapsales cyanobacterium LEGE 06147]